MRKSNGFLLIYDVIIFLLCSMLILSTASAWKNCIMYRQQYNKLNKAIYGIEDYIVGGEMHADSNITLQQQDISIGSLKELQVWEDETRARTLVNLFVIEAKR